jgi:dTDP-4-dehydrorhamnose reductase
MLFDRVLITGGNGMLGQAVYKTFAASSQNIRATDIDCGESWLEFLDVRDMARCEAFFSGFNPTLVLHLAALTDLEFCEQNPKDAWSTNALGTENIAILCRKHASTMVYISSAGVFDGAQEFYNDFDEPNPIGIYARSKFHGEKFVGRHLPEHYTFRAGWMMGGGPKKDKKFINKLFRQIQSGTKKIHVVGDKAGTPTYTVDFAEGIKRVVQSGFYGIYNQVCHGSCSRLELARYFVELLGLSGVEVLEVDSNFFTQQYFAPRPSSEKLVNLKLGLRGLDSMRDWRTCLAEYSRAYKEAGLGKI